MILNAKPGIPAYFQQMFQCARYCLGQYWSSLETLDFHWNRLLYFLLKMKLLLSSQIRRLLVQTMTLLVHAERAYRLPLDPWQLRSLNTIWSLLFHFIIYATYFIILKRLADKSILVLNRCWWRMMWKSHHHKVTNIIVANQFHDVSDNHTVPHRWHIWIIWHFKLFDSLLISLW